MVTDIVMILERPLAVGAIVMDVAIMFLEPRSSIEELCIIFQHGCHIVQGIYG
jgi:hypothetical protein